MPPMKYREPAAETRTVTMEDVARALGVAKVTVSHALSGKGRVSPETKAAVVKMAGEMGYRPNPHARNLNRGRSHGTVGLFSHSLDLGVTTRKLQLVQQLLAEHGYRAPVHICGGELIEGGETIQREALSDLRSQRPAGIICNTLSLHPSALQELRHYQEEGGAVVCYDWPVDLPCDQVVFDREHNCYLSTRHLLQLGHRRIMFHGGWARTDPPRLAGYRRALAEYGLKPEPELIFHGVAAGVPHQFQGGFIEEMGSAFVDQFLAMKPRPTAACILNDSAAGAFLTGLLRRGIRVPEEVSVVGHDNLPSANYLSLVPLTTVSQPLEAIADHAVRLLRERIEGDYTGPARTVSLTGELIVRASAGICHCTG